VTNTNPTVANTKRPVKTAVQSIDFASVRQGGLGTGSGSGMVSAAMMVDGNICRF
jgi:hypothetical protein